MGLTTERKVFFGLMVVAGAAFIIDQGFLGPKGAAADMIPITADTIGDQIPVPSPEPLAKPAAAILIDRIQSQMGSKSNASLDKVFSLTKMVEPTSLGADAHSPESGGGESASGEQTSFPLIAPRATDLPALSSVMPSKNGGGAVLAGKLVRVGQVGPSGYKLIFVHARAVLVERDGVQFAIEMPILSGQD